MADPERNSLVLIVDDNIDIANSLSDTLLREGYEILYAANGEEALRVLEKLKVPPCLILLDLMMPVMNGWEFIAYVEKHGLLESVPIVVISAHGSGGRLPGPISFVAKPFDLTDLLNRISTHCQGCSSPLE